MAYGSQHALRHGERLVVPRATVSPDSLSDAKARQAYRRSWSHRSPPAVSVRPKRGCCRGHDMGAGGPGQRRWPSHHNHHRVFRRDSFVASGYKDEADGIRVYDLASKAWCDGNNHCWTGKSAWTFKDGTWFYGSNRWYEAERRLADRRCGGPYRRRLRDASGIRQAEAHHRAADREQA